MSHQNLKAGDNSLLFCQFDGYKEILYQVIKSLHLPNQSELLKIIDQKYICRKLDIAKETGNKKDIKIYQKLFDEKVAPNNLYKKALQALED